MNTIAGKTQLVTGECQRCGDDFKPGNHRCVLTTGEVWCYECTLDALPPMAETEKERFSDWCADQRAAQVERSLR